MFMAALQSLGKLDDPILGTVPQNETFNLYFNLSKDDTHEELVDRGTKATISNTLPIPSSRARRLIARIILMMKAVDVI